MDMSKSQSALDQMEQDLLELEGRHADEHTLLVNQQAHYDAITAQFNSLTQAVIHMRALVLASKKEESHADVAFQPSPQRVAPAKARKAGQNV